MSEEPEFRGPRPPRPRPRGADYLWWTPCTGNRDTDAHEWQPVGHHGQAFFDRDTHTPSGNTIVGKRTDHFWVIYGCRNCRSVMWREYDPEFVRNDLEPAPSR